MKVLLFSNDTMPFGSLPTSGGGLRCWQLYQGLIAHGIEVIASMPAFTFLTKKYFNEIPEDVRDNLWEWHTQDDIYDRVKPDAVIFASNWDHYNLSKKPNVPLIVDLHGSRLIETSLWGEVPDINKKLDVFSKADCLLTAGKRQRMYFYGWLLQAGRIPEDEHFIRQIPISLSPEKFVREETRSEEYPYFVSGGGWFPWQDQSRAIFEICDSIVARNKGLIKIFGTPHENSTPSKDEQRIIEIFSKVKEFSKSCPQVRVEGYVGRDELLKEYSRASVAVELMKYNLERELAFTTRTIEYLWCGLPVLYNDYSEISEHIKEYDAGWAIDPENPKALKQVITEIFEDPNLVNLKSKNAQNLVKDRFSWDKTIEPLLNYLTNPKTLKVSKKLINFNPNRASYLYPSGKEISLEISESKTICQEFVFPAEAIWAVQLRILEVLKKGDGLLRINLKNRFNITIAKLERPISDLNDQEVLFLFINRFLRPFGGAKAKLIINIVPSSSKNAGSISLRALDNEVFPLKSINGLNDRKCIQLEFTPGLGRLYQLKTKATKVLWLIRQGDYKRILRALLKRVPGLKIILKPLL